MENETAKQIVDAALLVHSALGPGLLESVYETALFHELVKRGLPVARQVPVTFTYDGHVYDEGFRLDFWLRTVWLSNLNQSRPFTLFIRNNS